MKHFLFAFFAFAFLVNASAEAFPHRHFPIFVPRPHLPPLVTLLDFQCPAGVGWMKMTLVRPDGTKGYRTWYLGSVANCERQQEVLQENRVEIRQRKLIAICSPKPSYLTLYAVDPRGRFVQESQTYYGDLDRCLAHADEVNTR